MVEFESSGAFLSTVTVIEPPAATSIRRSVVEARADLALIEQLGESVLDRYLWDLMKEKEHVSEDELWCRVARVPSVLAMWDAHSLRVVEAVSLPGDVVIKADPATLRRGSVFLPEDAYLFDESYEWVAALTHEWVEGRRFCLWSGRSR